MIIAELSGNHGQEASYAAQLIDAAYSAGADAIKVQTYTPDTITIRSNKPAFKIKDQPLWKGRNLWDLYKEAYTPWSWQPDLKQQAESLGLAFIASVFDFSSVDFWEDHELQIYKIASAEIVDIPLLEYVASTKKSMIVSTGMATLEEISEAVDTIIKINPQVDLTLLKCSSAYPAPIESMNLRGIQTLKKNFHCPVGLSDHTLDNEIAVTAVGLGATVFEKHLKLEHIPATPDDAFSLTADEFKTWTNSIQKALRALGSAELKPSIDEAGTLPFRKSLFIVKNVLKGEVLTEENVKSIRPSGGLHPREYKNILGQKAQIDIEAGTALSQEMIHR